MICTAFRKWRVCSTRILYRVFLYFYNQTHDHIHAKAHCEREKASDVVLVKLVKTFILVYYNICTHFLIKPEDVDYCQRNVALNIIYNKMFQTVIWPGLLWSFYEFNLKMVNDNYTTSESNFVMKNFFFASFIRNFTLQSLGSASLFLHGFKIHQDHWIRLPKAAETIGNIVLESSEEWRIKQSKGRIACTQLTLPVRRDFSPFSKVGFGSRGWLLTFWIFGLASTKSREKQYRRSFCV